MVNLFLLKHYLFIIMSFMYVFRYISCIHLVVDSQFYIVIVSVFIIVSIYVYVSSLLFFIVCLFFNCIEIAKYHFNLLTYDQNWPIFTSHQKFQEVKPDTDVLGDRAVAPEMDKSLSNTAPARTKG